METVKLELTEQVIRNIRLAAKGKLAHAEHGGVEYNVKLEDGRFIKVVLCLAKPRTFTLTREEA